MLWDLEERLAGLTGRIERASQDAMTRLVTQMLVFSDDEEEPEEKQDPRALVEQEKSEMLALRSLRMQVYLELLLRGQMQYRPEMRKEWDEIVSCVETLQYGWKITPEILSDAVDLVCLHDPGKRGELVRQLDFATRLKIRKQTPLRIELVQAADVVIHYYLNRAMIKEGCAMAANLVALSQERNAAQPGLHREIVRLALHYTVDFNYQLSDEICWANAWYFDGVEDFNASRFCWYYGATLQRLDQPEEAVAQYDRCRKLCLSVEGPRSWIGARAGMLYHYYLLDSGETQRAEAFLWDALEKIDAGFYRDMDDSADFVAAHCRYVLLKIHMENQTLRGLLPHIQRYRSFCLETQDAPVEPRLTVRTAENMLTAYYFETGDYLQAAKHALNALQTRPPDGMEAVPSDDLVYANLLQIYSHLNDADQMLELAQLLADRLDDHEENDHEYFRICVLIQTVKKKLGIPMDEEIPDFRQMLLDFHAEMETEMTEGSPQDRNSMALWAMDLMASVMDAFQANRYELVCYQDIARFLLDHREAFALNRVQLMLIYMLLAQAQHQMKDPAVFDTLEDCLRLTSSLTVGNENRILVMRFAALVYHNMGKTDLALAVISQTLDAITAAWQKATAYLNDRRICQLLSVVQHYFSACYCVLRASVPTQQLYEYVLRFKNLAALVGRERNTMLGREQVDERLRTAIYSLQDQLAAAELNDALQGTETAADLSPRLQQLEADFAGRFRGSMELTEISLERLWRKLPDDAAVVEYYFAVDDAALGQRPAELQDWELDIFVVRKTQGQPAVTRHRIPRGDQILDQALAFVQILQEKDDGTQAAERERLRKALYQQLIAPVLPDLQGMRTVYLAPDLYLCNLPFEILSGEDGEPLTARFRVSRLVCGRDLLFCDDETSGSRDMFILGDPDFEAGEAPWADSLERGMELDLTSVPPLPFSGLEAARIGRRWGAAACTGADATKYALLDALPSGVVHLATHGVFDTKMASNALYSSYLVFAGYNSWVCGKPTDETHGNGILTADEISRLDMRGTDLVVLSACRTGLEDAAYGSVQGLLSAFSAAGVRWIVSHMWKASDIASPILMEAFYEAYLGRGMDVPRALQYAREYLRTVTVGQLRRAGWLDRLVDDRLGPQARMELERLRRANDRRRCFEDEYYWGGFVCHRCK